MLAILILVSCMNAEGPQGAATDSDTAPGAGLHDDGLPAAGVEGDAPAGWLQALAARGLADDLGVSRDTSFGVLALEGEERLYFFGDLEDVERALAGEAPRAPLPAVVVSGSTVGAPCVGTLDELPPALVALAGGARGSVALADDRLLTSEGDAFPLQTCPSGAPGWLDLFETQAEDFRDPGEPEAESVETWAAPPPSTCSASSCTSSCGASESSASYASQTAYSNGKYTGTGCGCTPSSSAGTTSTDDYQCTQFVDRVHGHDGGTYNWTGNASSGYWTSTSSGPYQKGLIPFGTGTSYDAPLAGDILVWSYSYGHVGIIGSVGSSTLTVYDQNRSCGSQSCTMGYSTSGGYTISNGSGRCFSASSSYTVLGYARRGWDFGATFGLASSSSTTNWWPNDASYVSGSSTSSGSYTGITDYIAINPGTSDPYLTSPAGLAVAAYSSSATHGYRYLKVYMKSDCSSKTAALYWKRTSDSSFSEDRKVTATVSSSWSTVTFNASSDSDWSGTIDQIRIDPASSCSSGSADTIYLAYAYFDR